MLESTRNNKTVFSFAVRDTKAAWQVAQKYMNDKYFRPHEEFRDLYYTTAPGLGMQYLQFFKTGNEIQVVTFLGGPVHPVPLSRMDPPTAQSVRTALKGMLEPLAAMEQQEAAAGMPVVEPAQEAAAPEQETATPEQQAAAPEQQTAAPASNTQAPLPTEIPATADAGFVSGTAPTAQPTANEYVTAGASSTMPEDQQPAADAQQDRPVNPAATFTYGSSTNSRNMPQDPYGTRYSYDPVNGGPNDRASNAVAGLVLGIIGLFAALLGMGLPALGVLALIPLTIGLICSVNGRRSRRRGIATAGLVISVVSVALVIFETLVWFEILRG